MTVTNKLTFTITNLGANATQRCDITESFKYENDFKPCNHLVAFNPTAKLVLIRLNDDENDVYPLPANGGKMVINPDDKINFHSLTVENTESAEATGTIRLTVGVL